MLASQVIRLCAGLLPAGLLMMVIPASAQKSFLPQTDATTPYFTSDQRWQHYVQRTYSWQRMAILGADTSIDLMMSPGRCGRGMDCWGNRMTGGFLRRTTRTTIELGAGILLKEDIRRRPSGEKALGKRLRRSMTRAFSAMGPDGEYKFSWSRTIGAAGGIATSAAYHHDRISAGRMTHSMAWALASNVQDSLMAEFSPDMARFGNRIKNRLFRKSPAAPPSIP